LVASLDMAQTVDSKSATIFCHTNEERKHNDLPVLCSK